MAITACVLLIAGGFAGMQLGKATRPARHAKKGAKSKAATGSKLPGRSPEQAGAGGAVPGPFPSPAQPLTPFGGTAGKAGGGPGSEQAEREEKLRRVAKVYAAMPPDQAAIVIQKLSDAEAVAVLGKMKEREVASILGALKPERAAQLTKKMSGM